MVFFVAYIKDSAVREVAWRSFRSNMYITVGAVIRVETTVGHFEGRMHFVDRRVILIESAEFVWSIPAKKFGEREWSVVKRRPSQLE